MRGEARRSAKRTSTRFPKKCNKPRDVLLGGSAGEGAANGDDDDGGDDGGDGDGDDDDDGDGDGRVLEGSGGAAAAAGAAGGADREPRHRGTAGFPARVYVSRLFT